MSTIGTKVIIGIIKARTRVDQNLKTELRVGHTRDKVCVGIVKSMGTSRRIAEIQRQGDPYLEAVNLSFIFTWDNGKNEDRANVFTSSLFKGLLINNTELQDISIGIKCMTI